MPFTKGLDQISNVTSITISFSVHYITEYGQELYVNLDDYTCKKMTWTNGHIWMCSITVVRPRPIKWSYSVMKGDTVLRVEDLLYHRYYSLDKTHKFFHVFDRWNNPHSSVSPLTFGELNTHEPLLFKENYIDPNRSNQPSPYIKAIFIPSRKVKEGYEAN
ncbi:Uncharacterized protein QTN25_007871 [Entamoeba marina]